MNTDGDFYTLVYYLPSRKPIVYPPLIIPSMVTNIETQLTFTTSFIITEIKKLHTPNFIIFLFKKNTKTGKIIHSIKDINNGILYNTDYYAVSGVVDNDLKIEYKNLLNEVNFKSWKDLGDERISKILDLSFSDSEDSNIRNSSIKDVMRESFKKKELTRDNCIVMGKDGKAIGIGFPTMDINESNDEVIFGSAYYYGIVPKMRSMGYSNVLFAGVLDKLRIMGVNSYKGRVHKDNIRAISTFRKFDFEVYDSLMLINMEN
jgi:hypothetical protein